MEYSVITSGQFSTTEWPGGTTKELFIFPVGASYPERNFQFRLSTATVESERSDFTHLPGFSRKLMILDGKITLRHEGKYSKELNPFEMDSFEGDWKTSSIGKCTDFNLMMKKNVKGALSHIFISADEAISHPVGSDPVMVFVYVFQGEINIITGDQSIRLNAGDLFIIESPGPKSLKFEAIRSCDLVLADLIYQGALSKC